MASSNANNGKFQPDFKVMFGNREAALTPLPPFSILIVASEDDFNDFGFRTKIDIHIRLELKSDILLVRGHLGFVTSKSSEPSDVKYLGELLSAAGALTVSGGDSHHFFTMLPSMDDYRTIVVRLGVDAARQVLMAINDVVALKELRPSLNVPELAAGTSVFQKSFVRTSQAYYAFKNAGSILRGLHAEEFGRLSKNIGVKFQLSGRQNAHELTFRFDHQADLPKRIAVVIGKNGVGKSQALGRMARAALKGDEGSLFDEDTKGRVVVNRLLAFAPTNEAGSVFPSDRHKAPKVWYRRFALNRSGRSSRGSGLSDLVLQVARSDGRIGGVSRWKMFTNAIEAISKSEQIYMITVGERLPVQLLTLRMAGGEDRLLETFASIDLRKDPVRMVDGRPFPLSSGEFSFLRFAAQASLYVENGSLLLLDEPETHLHPNFISQFVSLLDGLLSQTGSAAVIATHSAYFVREVFREQVTVLRTTDEGFAVTEPLRLQTFGADVGSISYFVFGEDEPSRLATEVERRLLSHYEHWDDLYADYKDELSPELLSSLRLALDGRDSDE